MIALVANHVLTDPKALTRGVARSKGSRVARSHRHSWRSADASRDGDGDYPPSADQDQRVFKVEAFVEKSGEVAARTYVKNGYLWNCRNFIFRAGVLLNEYRKFEPDSVNAIEPRR